MPEILKNIKAEDRLKNIRIVSENDDVMGGQPEADGMKENDNNAIFDLACSVMHALAEVAKVDQKAIPQILDALGDSRTAGASQRIVNEVNKLAKAAQTAANQANDKANTANIAAATADKKAVTAQNTANVAIPKAAIAHENGTAKDKVASQFLVSEIYKAVQEALRLAVPVGSIFNWPGETAPNTDWLIMRGQKYGKDQYPELYDLLKTDTLPDGRGVMLRGLDAGRGFDPGRALLSYQEDAMQTITGYFLFARDTSGAAPLGRSKGAFYDYNQGADGGSVMAGNISQESYTIGFSSSLVTRSNTQNETVSKNIALNIIIKVK